MAARNVRSHCLGLVFNELQVSFGCPAGDVRPHKPLLPVCCPTSSCGDASQACKQGVDAACYPALVSCTFVPSSSALQSARACTNNKRLAAAGPTHALCCDHQLRHFLPRALRRAARTRFVWPGEEGSVGNWAPRLRNVYFLHGSAMQENDDAPLALPQDYNQRTQAAFRQVCPSLCNRHHPLLHSQLSTGRLACRSKAVCQTGDFA